MKFTLASVLACVSAASAHTIFQRISVDGQDHGQLNGLRTPNHNNPVQDVNSQDLTCGQVANTSPQVIPVPAGARVGSYWQHVIGGEQFPGDPDNPIARSHHGPITAWLAPVADAASASHQGQQWFKIFEEGYDVASGIWAVDRMVQGNGWHYFDMPSCVASGQYLLRVEMIALHSAYETGGAQFYTSCAQIEVTGGGSFTGGQMVSIPGVYQQNDPAIVANIYGAGGVANNNGQPYTPAGPRPITC